MKRIKTKDRISIIEAIDILSSLSEVDSRISFLPEMEEDKDSLHPTRWLNEDRIQENEELVKEAFEAVRYYFEQIYAKHQGHFEDHQVQKGIEAVVFILQEAKEKLIQFTGLFKRGFSVKDLFELKEYREMMEHLERQIIPNLPSIEKKMKERQKEEFFQEGLEDQVDSFEDLEEIKSDLRYELFYLKKENGKPFYDQECMRRLQLLYDFEKGEESNNPMLANLRLLEAKDFQKRAIAILVGTDSLVRDFYKLAFKEKNNAWASSLSKALMSLMLAATPQTLAAQDVSPKTASFYFSDFRGYLRDAINSIEYKKFISKEHPTPAEKRFSLLTHKLCSSYFLSISVQKEVTAFLKDLAGLQKKHNLTSDVIHLEDEALREILHKSPNGPIKKIISAFLKGEFEDGWDPLAQNNALAKLFHFTLQGKEVGVINMPAPLRQRSLESAKVVEEFYVFLERCLLKEEKKILFIDLQDGTSFEEHSRVVALQGLLESKEHNLGILRLAKHTDFYFQKNEYQNEEQAAVFMHHLEEQILTGGACGYAYPKHFDRGSLKEFIQKSSLFIHEVFFSKRKTLNCRERQDFIEIFYSFFILKTAEIEKPDYIIFTSKDGLDTTVSSGAELFFSVKSLFSDHVLKQKDQDFLLWLLYAPVLMLRERAIHKVDAERVMHFMETLEAGIAKNGTLLEKYLKSLYPKNLIKDVDIC
ncbi:MAG: hypothetical protein V4489_02400 [Chlamydiota bacterium]